MLGSPFTARRRNIGVLAIIISALVLLGLGASAAPDASLFSLVPLDSPVVASLDLPWVWKSTADIRKNSDAVDGLKSLEKALGLSIENDLLPWAGQMAIAVTGIRQDEPEVALYLQIRDADHMIESARLEAILTAALAGKSKVTWLGMDCKGIAIRRTEINSGKSVVKIATAKLNGWLVITFGEGVIRKVIDASIGAGPSLEAHPLFAKATVGLPEGAIGQLCVNGQGILSQIQRNDAAMARQVKDSELGKFFLAGAMTAADNTVQADVVYCTGSPKTQATLKQLRAAVGIISGASLAQLPEGTFATLLIPNPDKWVGAVGQMISDSLSDARTRKEFQQSFSEIDDLRAILKLCSGELGIGGAWREGKGFGVAIAAETGKADDATAASTAISDFLEEMYLPSEEKNGLHTIPMTESDDKTFSTLLCWATRQQWLLAASHPDWVAQPEAKPSLELPAFAKDANLATFGNFSFIPTMMKAMGAPNDVIAMLDASKLADEKWALALKIDEDGGAVRCHISGGLPVFAMTAAVVFPVFAKAREKARQAQSINNLKQLSAALLFYAQDNDEKLPVIKTAADLSKLGVDDRVLIIPRTKEPYTFNPIVSGKELRVFKYPSTMIVLYEKTPDAYGGRCAAFLDGHVAWISAASWAAAKKLSKIP